MISKGTFLYSCLELGRSCRLPSKCKGERRRRCPLRVFVTARLPLTRGHTCECQHGTVKCDRTSLDSNKLQFNTSNQTSLMERTTVTRPIGVQRDIYQAATTAFIPAFLNQQELQGESSADKSNANKEAQRRLLAVNVKLFCGSISVPTCTSA